MIRLVHVCLTVAVVTILGSQLAHSEIAAMPARRPPPVIAFGISDMHAFLFLRDSGSWHAQDLFTATGLWNTSIGEGIAGEPASTASLVIALQGQTFTKAPGKLTVIATQGKVKLLSQTVSVSELFTSGKKSNAVFLMQGIGCGDIVVTATWQGLPDPKRNTMTKKINMACGE
jgi:hypothetical protein